MVSADTDLETNLNTSKEKVKSLQTKVTQVINNHDFLNDKLDDMQNRSMRANLVFTGLDELNSESYDTTKELLVKTISERLNVPSASVSSQLVRAHRSRFNSKKKDGPRPIFVKFDREDTAQKYLQEIIKIKTK